MKPLALYALVLIASLTSASALISVALVDSPEKMPDHLKIRTSPGSNDLINVWVTILEKEPEGKNIWASLETRIDGKLLSRANLDSHPQEEGFSVSFQLAEESFAESTVMISVRGAGRSDVGHSIQLSLFPPGDTK